MEQQTILQDGVQNAYIDIENVRLSLIYKTGDLDWARTGSYLRFAAYTGEGQKIFQGPELPLRDENVFNATEGSGLQVLGQLAVHLPSNVSLSMYESWDVEPLGIIEGTNAFGAAIQVPEIRFWRYTSQRYPQDSQEPQSDIETLKINQFKATKTELIRRSLGLTAASASNIFWTTSTGFHKTNGHKFAWVSADAAKNGSVVHYTWQYDPVDGSLLATNNEAQTIERAGRREP